MAGRPFTLLSALSLLLCVAVVVLWVRSERVIDLLVLEASPTKYRALGLREGAVYYLRTEVYGGINADTFDMSRGGPPGYRTVRFSDTLLGTSMPREDEFLGFFHGKFDIAPGQEALEASVPLWPLLTPPVVLLVLAVRVRVHADARRDRGLCVGCGYDLRATPGRCPECGTVAAAKEA